jgi:hypothetical protein
MTVTAVRQARRPQGAPTQDDFVFVTEPMPSPGPGEILVENIYLSVDPYMREMMDFGGWEKGLGLEGRSLGRVISTNSDAFPVGSVVFHRNGWCTHAVVPEQEARLISQPDGVPLSAFLGVLGGTGLTAYVGLKRIARLAPGEDIFISAAAGAVGSVAGQLARQLGAGRVVGSAGSFAKVSYLTDRLGFDAAFNYRSGSLTELLSKAAPAGIDVYFDNVGGDHLAAAIESLREFGRIAWCGAIAQYNTLDVPPAAPYNLFDVQGKSIRMEGFGVRHHLDAREEFERFLVPLLQDGSVVNDETVIVGFPNIVDAFLRMLRGENVGKMLVQVTAI